MFYPTMVIGIGDLAHSTLHEFTELFKAFQSPTRHITAVGVYSEGGYQELHAPKLDEATKLESLLAQWLYATRAEHNIDRARQGKVEVGPPSGYLLEQVFLIVDSTQHEQMVHVVSEIEELCRSANDLVPARLHILILHPHYNQSLPPTILHWWAQRKKTDSELQSAQLWITRLLRSDGSIFTSEELRLTMIYSLLCALHPAEFEGEHWLYRNIASTETIPGTFGCGLVVLPLHRILRALQDKFVADSLQAFLRAARSIFEPPKVEEETLWKTIVQQSVQAWGQDGSDRIKLGSFPTVACEMRPPAITSRGDTVATMEIVDEWESNLILERLPRLRELLSQKVDEQLRLYRETMRKAIHHYLNNARADLSSLVTQLELLVSSVQLWQIHSLPSNKPSSKQKDSLRRQIQQIIEQPTQKTRFGRIKPPKIPKDTLTQYTEALRQYYGSQIQAEVTEVFRGCSNQLLTFLTEQLKVYSELRGRIEQEIRERNERAESFQVRTLPWLRPLVSHWAHLEPVAQELWGQRDLASLVAKMMDTDQNLLQMLPLVIERLQQQFARLVTPRYRRFSYYLQSLYPGETQRALWCQHQLDELRLQAQRTLWLTEKVLPRSWQITPPDDSGSSFLMPHAPDKHWQSDSMLGLLATTSSVVLDDIEENR